MEQPAHRQTKHYRTALGMFVIGLALGLMARDLAISAYAQVMDPGQQRNEMNQGISQLNAKMSEMLTVLRTGTLKVRVVETDKRGGTAPSVSFGPMDGTRMRPEDPDSSNAPHSPGGAER